MTLPALAKSLRRRQLRLRLQPKTLINSVPDAGLIHDYTHCSKCGAALFADAGAAIRNAATPAEFIDPRKHGPRLSHLHHSRALVKKKTAKKRGPKPGHGGRPSAGRERGNILMLPEAWTALDLKRGDAARGRFLETLLLANSN